MKVLLITSKPPYPTIDGGCFASAQFLESILQTDTEVDLFTLSTHKHPFDPEAFPHKIKHRTREAFVDTEVSLVGALKSLFTKESYNVERFDSSAVHETLKQTLVSTTYTHVILDSLFSTPYLKTIREFSDAKTYIRTHNVENAIWEQKFKTERNPFKRALLGSFYKKLKRYEIETLQAVDGIFSISEDDSALFRSQGVTTKICYIPVGLEIKDHSFKLAENRFFHIGSMNWEPNVEAVKRLINLMPELKSKYPRIELHIAGKKGKLNNTDPNVFEDGFVNDVMEYAINNGVMVSPISSGSGVKIKILEMLSLGVPIITSSKGAEGLGKTDFMVIADTDEELIQAIIEAMEHPDKMQALATKGKEYIASEHNIVKIGNQIVDCFDEC